MVQQGIYRQFGAHLDGIGQSKQPVAHIPAFRSNSSSASDRM
jgi:hypothetical protein